MDTKEIILEFLRKNKSKFFKKYNLTKLGLFGSYATSSQTPESDIDIIVEFKPNTSNLYEIKKSLKEELVDYFGKEVDLCREKYIKDYFKSQILEKVIYV